jgi:tRNA threonylcarbamoyl adenosine modification protein YeaZ
MKILALELSTGRGGLAWIDGEVERVYEWPNDRKNSAAFFQNLNAVTKKFGAPETIIVGLGPGSYAGTRISIAAAIGLQLSSGARLIGVPSICAIEYDADEYRAIGDARRKSFFFAHIRGRELTEGPMLYSESEMKRKLDKLEPTIPIFSSESLPLFERAVVRYPSALVLARVAREPRRSFSLPPLEPIYLREPHITVPKIGTET